jgi:hypothetical protein
MERQVGDTEKLRKALAAIDQEISWWFSCAGAVSRDDILSMFRGVRAQIDGVRDVVWPETDEPEAAPLDNNF